MSDEDKDTSFDYEILSVPIELVPSKFRIIFECPCLSTETKNKFAKTIFEKYIPNNFFGEQFRKQCEGKYACFLNFEYVGMYISSDIDKIKNNLDDVIVIFNMNDHITYLSKNNTLYQSPCVNIKNDYENARDNHNFYVDCEAYFMKNNVEKITICNNVLYLYDTGSSFTSIDISKFIDYSNLKFASNLPPNILHLSQDIKKFEFTPVETSNGIIYKIIFHLVNPIYFKLNSISETDIYSFTTDIPVIKFKQRKCFPGRYLSCCFKFPNNECTQIPLLGLNVINKLWSLTLPEINENNNTDVNIEKHEYPARLIVRNINNSEDYKTYFTLSFKKNTLLQKLDTNTDYYFSVLEYNKFRTNYNSIKEYYITTKTITLVCFDDSKDIDGYFENRIIDGFFISNDDDNYMFLNYENSIKEINESEIINFQRENIQDCICGMGAINDFFEQSN